MAKEKSTEKTEIKLYSTLIPWIVFLFSISIVLISFVSVIFPSLVLVSDTLTIPGIESVTPEPFETGVWSGGVIAVCAITFGLMFLYYKNKLPKSLANLFRKLLTYEISKKSAFITLLVLLVVYTVAASTEISSQEIYADYVGVKQVLDRWSPDEITKRFEPFVRFFFLKSSIEIFGNVRVIPLLTSASLLVVTYFFTKMITQKRFAGIISVLIIMQSSVFLTYDTTATYTNFWILFYLLSLYLAYKFWPLSPVLYFCSIMSKALTSGFLPMSIYFILRSDISRKKKAITAGITAAMILGGGVVAWEGFSVNRVGEEYDEKEFWMGFTSFAYQLRFDGLIMLFTIPLMVGLFLVSRKGVKHGESIMVFISGILLITPVLTAFTTQTNQPYRFVPLVVFFAVGVGVLLSKRQA